MPSHTDDGYLRIERDIVDAAYKLECDTYDAMVAAYNGMNDSDKKSTLLSLVNAIISIIMRMIKTNCVKSTCMQI